MAASGSNSTMEKFQYQESAEKLKTDKLRNSQRKRLFNRISESDDEPTHADKKKKVVTPPVTAQGILVTFQNREYEKSLNMIEMLEAQGGSIDVNSAQFIIIKAACLTMLDIKNDETMEMLTNLIKQEPKNSYAYYGLGLYQYRQADLSKCIKSFATAIDLNGTAAMKRALEFKAKAKSVTNLINDGKFSISTFIFLPAASARNYFY